MDQLFFKSKPISLCRSSDSVSQIFNGNICPELLPKTNKLDIERIEWSFLQNFSGSDSDRWWDEMTGKAKVFFSFFFFFECELL